MTASEIGVAEPDLIRVQRDADGPWQSAPLAGVGLSCSPVGDGLAVRVEAASISRVQLRWRRAATPGARVLGDAWERSYGDLQWRGLHAELVLPWSVLVHDPAGGATWGAGVEVRAGAFAAWTVDPDGVSLWLDLRSGSGPVRLGERQLTAAVVRWVADDADPLTAQRALMTALCRDPLPVGPLVGCNNWYYAYGRDFDADAVIRDARRLSELVGEHPVRPYGVVDDGWTPDGTADGRRASGGPWNAGRKVEFPDMEQVAGSIAAEGVRPGLWFRPLLSRTEPAAGVLRRWENGYALDPSHPATSERVAAEIRRFREWGFELVKHDFSTFDALGRWGFQMGARPAGDGPTPADPTRTTAEVLVDFYRVIAAAAAEKDDRGIVLGCNVVGQLAAGLVHAQRTGDDTSGLVWERTRRMGVNTLAFRLAQHRRFFTVDADCVPCTPATDWRLNRQFLDLVARSGTALFVSVDPAARNDRTDADLSAALRLALDGGAPAGIEPLDWLDTTTPARWRSGTDILHYDWFEEAGADPFDETDAGAFVD